MTWDLKVEGDYVPYADSPAQYWTGYYTSRGALKWFIRSRENLLRTAEILNVLTTTKKGPNNDAFDSLEKVNKHTFIFFFF
jgi:alpha-mannosidase